MKKVQDHYFQRAKREGYAARSVYKLEELDQRYHLLSPGMRVLDLGCAPGSWLQYAARCVGPQGRVVGVDLQALEVSLPPQVRVIQADVFELAPEELAADGAPFDLVISDMAPRTSGIKSADAARSAQLVLRALALAEAVLRPGGTLLVKVFQGAQLPELRNAFRLVFSRVSIAKPRASRSESVEVYLLGDERLAPSVQGVP
ncbi:MAG TPA: RlmE family RNA methyltransferase [bacterium]|nr:RlmE family RNA methyltransferase [bacterium]